MNVVVCSFLKKNWWILALSMLCLGSAITSVVYIKHLLGNNAHEQARIRQLEVALEKALQAAEKQPNANQPKQAENIDRLKGLVRKLKQVQDGQLPTPQHNTSAMPTDQGFETKETRQHIPQTTQTSSDATQPTNEEQQEKELHDIERDLNEILANMQQPEAPQPQKELHQQPASSPDNKSNKQQGYGSSSAASHKTTQTNNHTRQQDVRDLIDKKFSDVEQKILDIQINQVEKQCEQEVNTKIRDIFRGII